MQFLFVLGLQYICMYVGSPKMDLLIHTRILIWN